MSLQLDTRDLHHFNMGRRDGKGPLVQPLHRDDVRGVSPDGKASTPARTMEIAHLGCAPGKMLRGAERHARGSRAPVGREDQDSPPAGDDAGRAALWDSDGRDGTAIRAGQLTRGSRCRPCGTAACTSNGCGETRIVGKKASGRGWLKGSLEHNATRHPVQGNRNVLGQKYGGLGGPVHEDGRLSSHGNILERPGQSGAQCRYDLPGRESLGSGVGCALGR